MAKKKRVIKSPETVREKTKRAQTEPKPRRVRQTVNRAGRTLKSASDTGRREYHVPLPDNKLGRFLSKRFHFVPRFLKNAWLEVREVEWPNRHETTRLSIAVFIFAIIFGTSIWVVDLGLERVFKAIILPG